MMRCYYVYYVRINSFNSASIFEVQVRDYSKEAYSQMFPIKWMKSAIAFSICTCT